MRRVKTTAAVAIAAAALIQGCSTMDRVNAQDWSPYSGTSAARTAPNANAFDEVSSAVADTVLLPFTATSYAFGYRYDPSAHAMRQTANNWGWSSYPPTGTSASSSGGAMSATGSTGSSTTTGTTGGTPAMGTTMSSGTSPDPGARTLSTPGYSGAAAAGAGTTGSGTSATSSGKSGTANP